MTGLFFESTRAIAGIKADHDAFTGVEGKLTFVTDSKNLYVHDGITQGGIQIGPNITATGSTTARSLSDRFAEVYNILDWKLAVDADHTAAYNRIVAVVNGLPAADFPVAIYIPPGQQILFTAALTVITNIVVSTCLIGAARNASNLKLTGAAQIVFGDATNRTNNSTVESLNIAGQQTADAAILFANCNRPQGINVSGWGTNGHLFQFGEVGGKTCSAARLDDIHIPQEGGTIDGIAKFIVPAGETSGDNVFNHCYIQGRPAATDGAFHFEIDGQMDGLAIYDLFTQSHTNAIKFNLDGTGAGAGKITNWVTDGGQFDGGDVDINVVNAGNLGQGKINANFSSGGTLNINLDATSNMSDELSLNIIARDTTDSAVIIDNDSTGGLAGSVIGKIVANAGGNATTNTKDMVRLIGAFDVVDLDLVPLNAGSRQWKHAVQVSVDGPTFIKESTIRVHGNDFGTDTADVLTIANLAVHNDSRGTFTPVLTFTAVGDLSVVYVTQLGFWERVGNIIHYWLDIQTSTFTHTTASGQVRITGMPFTSSAISGFVQESGTVAFEGYTDASYPHLTASLTVNSSQLSITKSGSGQVINVVGAGDMPTAGTVRIRIAGYYRID